MRTIKKGDKKIFIFLMLFGVMLLFFLLNLNVCASGLVDDTINSGNEYSKHPIDNYQLDYYVDTSWNWLPWKWLDGIGDSVIYGIYVITNFIWMLSVYISKATGFAVQEAYRLDFISDMADSIGRNIQTLTGISPGGISTDGFFYGFLALFILVIGAYVAYVGLIKKETSKAISSVTHFILVFVLSGALIASAPTLIKNINEFSKDVSTGALTAGTKIVMPDSESRGQDSTDLIRDCLFGVQVKMPWTILQFGTTDVEASRVDGLLSASTAGITEDGEADSTREDIVKSEIEESKNLNLTSTKAASRLGVAFFVFIFNLIISVFVLIMTAQMILSQIMFIVYAMFLPFAFLFSTLPTYGHLAKRGIEKFFNTIMTRAGITLVVTVAFSISTMFYNISSGYPFFLIAFLQIITFVGISMKMNDILSLFGLHSENEQRIINRVMRRPRMTARRVSRGVSRALSRGRRGTASAVAGSYAAGAGAAGKTDRQASRAEGSETYGKRRNTANIDKNQKNEKRKNDGQVKRNTGQRAGQKVGSVMDTKEKISDNAKLIREKAKNIPTNAQYAVYKGKEQIQESVDKVKGTVRDNVQGFKGSVSDTRKKNSAKRTGQLVNYQAKMEERRKKAGQPVDSVSKPVDSVSKPVDSVSKPMDSVVKPDKPFSSRTPEKEPENARTNRTEPGNLQQPVKEEDSKLVSSKFDTGKEKIHTRKDNRRKNRKRRK